jgi:pyrroloquinoline-quinone synthase
MNKLLNREEFVELLNGIGKLRYHNLHPFHKLLHSGKCSKIQVQAWALNRYYYQYSIPIKDAILLSKFENSDDRRQWRGRLNDHDGDSLQIGGLQRWMILCEGIGLDKNYVQTLEGISPTTRFAVEAYINFVRNKSLLEAVASSLTEMFSPNIISERFSGMLQHYDFVDKDMLGYFIPRLYQAPNDVNFAINFVCNNATTVELQISVLKALEFKCDVLWTMCDALYYSYVSPGFKTYGMF